ncbi:ubiquitin carboxyl-terminal hydrolase CYLD [Aulostomus maculatus]
MSSGNRFFIITKKPDYPTHIKAGCLCYTHDSKYRLAVSKPGCHVKLPVTPLNSHSSLPYEIDMKLMEEVSAEEAGMLLSVEGDSERLKMFKDRDALQRALTLSEGSEVTVEEGGKKLKGIIRYTGYLTPPTSHPLSGIFFGIELQGEDRGKGKTDGSYYHQALFRCEKDCGIFAPFPRVRPRLSSSLSPAALTSLPQLETEGLAPGDRVTYFTNDYCRHGMVVDMQEKDGDYFVRISTDTDERGKTGGELVVPLQLVAKGEVPAETEHMDLDRPAVEPNPEAANKGLSISSLVEVTLAAGNSFGIIRWIGTLPDRHNLMAGIELEEPLGVSDGTVKEERYFTCAPKRALFVKLSSLRPDSRFYREDPEREQSTGILDPVLPISAEQVDQVLIGRMKGIQGHCNSCYMDAALFSLFSCSSVLDSMLFKSTEPQDAPIQKTLLHDIVNPLRSKGFVEGKHIMKLRQLLQKHGYSRSFTTDEKDPEEFLNVIMHHILALDPLLKLSASGKVQESYCYQIFLDQNHSLVLPTVQQLLEHSFHSARLKLAEVPSCLILQMPRFGKKFKMFEKIIPSLELDITDLRSEGPQQCMLCGKLAEVECIDCFNDPVFSLTGCKIFCVECSSQVHSHPRRQRHQTAALDIPKGYLRRGVTHPLTRDKLELFAVLCIETSHYVSFIKYGPNSQDWIFFDSMADRQGESDGFNIPVVHPCPEVTEYLVMPPAELANQVPRDMKGVAKRLFCDAYMYLYQSPSMCLYR